MAVGTQNYASNGSTGTASGGVSGPVIITPPGNDGGPDPTGVGVGGTGTGATGTDDTGGTTGGSTGTGGTSGTPIPPSNGPTPTDITKLTSTGGLAGNFGGTLIPMVSNITGAGFFYFYDTGNLNVDEVVSYQFRVEMVEEGKFPTIERVRIRYRDLGKVTIIVVLTGADVNSIASRITFGGKNDGKIRTAYADLELTCENPQCIIVRDVSAGQLDLIGVTLVVVSGDGPQL